MALFRRNKTADSPDVPEEVSNYYQAEKRDRTWMAWLLALLSLAVTALLVMGLFFGGRWIYRKIRPNNPPAVPIAGNQTNESPAPNGGANAPADNTDPSQQEKEKEEQRKREEEEKRKEQERARVNAPANPVPAGPAAPNPGTGTTGSGPATTTTPNANTDLPGTGPGDVVAVFVLTTVAGALVHRYVLRQTNS